MKAIFLEVFFFYVQVINKLKLMSCTFILKNVINWTDENRAASCVNRHTRNKFIFHTEPNTFFSNIYNTFGDKIFISFCIKNVICPHVQNSNVCFDVCFIYRWLNIVGEVFRCSTTKEMISAVYSAKSSIQIPNIYDKYAITKITMLLKISDDALLLLLEQSRFVLILILLLSFIWSFIFLSSTLFVNSNLS